MTKPKYAEKLKKKQIIEKVKEQNFWEEFFIKNEEKVCKWAEIVSKEELFLMVPFGPTLEACANYFAEKLSENLLYFDENLEIAKKGWVKKQSLPQNYFLRG